MVAEPLTNRPRICIHPGCIDKVPDNMAGLRCSWHALLWSGLRMIGGFNDWRRKAGL